MFFNKAKSRILVIFFCVVNPSLVKHSFKNIINLNISKSSDYFWCPNTTTGVKLATKTYVCQLKALCKNYKFFNLAIKTWYVGVFTKATHPFNLNLLLRIHSKDKSRY
ncbi:hypothetical protein BpHYR1_037278 [Brachionus plicatilis]|uniref:Uncharacterized protein n=1 Tax=Brachionus plicatilis TaxID=10195 RepID=A0A3M7QM51_BRAPC|nr:hypothetical protein BpHYR1_037278 [Brachionus plicatilis]